ncbi:hypothetical protein FSARC_10871 [Fusarium sarcochroum]|uniref:homogentisate 1,2-dioxygenase n=1 Tax=Fusarium sarcochroum TaxID=1208366 RepID=A0A8H4TJF0_9HYPO|nr:hypothetical protein FSARC_10871 [Fusarium sarcochroum]
MIVKPSIQISHQLRWDPFGILSDADYITGLCLVAGAVDATVKSDLAINSPGGDFLIVAKQGALDICTELGRLLVRSNEDAVIPLGVRFRVDLVYGLGTGYILEGFQGVFKFPELGPIGPNRPANLQNFQVSIADHEDDQSDWVVTVTLHGQLCDTAQDHSPFNVVALHGNHSPYKHDLGRFNTSGSIRYDRPDPSISFMLTAPSPVAGTAIADFVIFSPRWPIAEDTFRSVVSSKYYGREAKMGSNQVERLFITSWVLTGPMPRPSQEHQVPILELKGLE